MRAPFDDVIVNVGGAFGVKAVVGTGLKDSQGVSRHIGVDLRAREPKPVRSPGDGVIISATTAPSGNKILSVRIGDKEHRFLHLSKFVRTFGDVKEGEVIAVSGDTGGVDPHLHWDVRKAGTTWNQSFSNYVDPMSIINQGGGVEMFTKEQIKALADVGEIKQTPEQLAEGAKKPAFEVAMNLMKTLQSTANKFHSERDELAKTRPNPDLIALGESIKKVAKG